MTRPHPDPEFVNFLPRESFTRREVIVTSLAAGFALAVRPISAQTITTSAEGLEAGEVKIPAADGQDIPAYRAMPEGGGPFPVILVVQEIFGVHEHIRDLCRRLASTGYLAIAPELYARQGDVSGLKDISSIQKIVARVPDAQVLSDLDAAVDWASDNKGDIQRLGITGFCWGGRIVWLYAAHSPRLKAGVAWYGRLTGNRNELQPKYPIDIAANLKAPVLGLYAGQDRGIPLEDVEKMREALKQAKVKTEIAVYPNAQHGFNADYRPSYSETDAKAAWKRMLEWFRANGV